MFSSLLTTDARTLASRIVPIITTLSKPTAQPFTQV
jgi:hypothetical protein